MKPQSTVAFPFAVVMAAAAGMAYAHCSPGPGVECVSSPCHHGEDTSECRGVKGGYLIASNMESSAVKQDIIVVLKDLRLREFPPDGAPVMKLAAPLAEPAPLPIALPASAIKTKEDVKKVQAQVLSIVRDSQNAHALVELTQKNPKAASEAVNRMSVQHLKETFEELKRWNTVLEAAQQKGTDRSEFVDSGIEQMRGLTDKLTSPRKGKP